MAVLGPEYAHKKFGPQGLVQGLSERELTNPEGAGFDLRLGEVYRLKAGRGFLGVTERDTPKVELVAKFDPDAENPTVFRLMPGEYVIIKTIETVDIPEGLAAYNYTRTTLLRSGVLLIYGQIPPGYSGELNFGLFNARTVPKDGYPENYAFDVEMGARISHIQFEEVKGKANKYRGQWKGGRTTTTGKETQV